MEVIKLNKVWFKYDDEWALKDVSFSVTEKEFLGVVGPNGGGKTTLLKIMLGLLKPQKGSVKTLGVMSYVPQHLTFDKYFPISVQDVVLMGLIDHLDMGIKHSAENIKKAHDVMKKLGILGIAKARFGKLSGGQRQRVLIARAIINNPDILILDEPTANIDKEAQEIVHNILLKLNEEITIIMVSHHFDLITTDVDRVICIDKGMHIHPVHELEGQKFAIIDHSEDKG